MQTFVWSSLHAKVNVMPLKGM